MGSLLGANSSCEERNCRSTLKIPARAMIIVLVAFLTIEIFFLFCSHWSEQLLLQHLLFCCSLFPFHFQVSANFYNLLLGLPVFFPSSSALPKVLFPIALPMCLCVSFVWKMVVQQRTFLVTKQKGRDSVVGWKS